MTPPVADVVWLPSWRIIPSRFPTIDVYERVVETDDADAVFEIENLTNDRLRHQEAHPEDHRDQPGDIYIMAALTHISQDGSRFSDGTYGVYYCALAMETAIEETKYHRARFLAATNEAPMEIDMRVLCADLDGRLHDIRAEADIPAGTLDPDSYKISQTLALSLREQTSAGIVYPSVRHSGGEAAAVFTPDALANARQERHLCYRWDGEAIAEIYEKRNLSPDRR